MPGFLSDNNAGLCPEALHAIHEANGPHQPAYGDDDYTAAAERELRRIFTEAVSVWFVATGTAANTLAIAALTEPWQQVLCHLYSHYNHDESTAPERVTHCRTVGLPTDTGKLEPADITRVGRQARGDVHQPQPGVVTLSNPTEFGTPARRRDALQPDGVRNAVYAEGAGGVVPGRPRGGLQSACGRGDVCQRGGGP